MDRVQEQRESPALLQLLKVVAVVEEDDGGGAKSDAGGGKEHDTGPDLGATFRPGGAAFLDVVAGGVEFEINIYHDSKHAAGK